ncbi:MAG: DNA gyrase inhibitor YacG [Bdellovibrionota bacterium]
MTKTIANEKDNVVRMIQCPRCQKNCEYSDNNPHRPFCCRLCKDEDIIAWSEESYRAPDREASAEEVLEAIKSGK